MYIKLLKNDISPEISFIKSYLQVFNLANVCLFGGVDFKNKSKDCRSYFFSSKEAILFWLFVVKCK